MMNRLIGSFRKREGEKEVELHAERERENREE